MPRSPDVVAGKERPQSPQKVSFSAPPLPPAQTADVTGAALFPSYPHLTGLVTMGTEPANQNTQFQKHRLIIDTPSPRQVTSQHSEASQGPLLLDKQIKLPPIFLQGGKGTSSTCDAQGQNPSLQSPSLEHQSHTWPCHDAAVTKEPPRISCSRLEHTWSSESDVRSFRFSSLENSRNSSLVSSGYAGDEESSEISLVCNSQLSQLGREHKIQEDDTQTDQLYAAYCPSQLKSPQTGQADSTEQAGGEK
ncbi:LOW QUALITY PROTEIN: protein TNT [Choloepus didactylus]|uniref:LOW QUALITY PROTEIN: protein TNT n=1 Tax=Choloepus didactylus TaxID=27675 RepID=UPI00189FA3D8|nr:LOW QUALITY PROTEIN: protein TNT [Choloepus didactylus]